MKLKTRLIISFCIIIFVPVFLMFCALFGFQYFQLRELEQTYGRGGNGAYTYLTNSAQLLNRYTKEVCQELVEIARKSPEQLEDVEYLEQVNEQLLDKFSYLVVRRGQTLIYKGGGGAEITTWQLPDYGEGDSNPESRYFLNGDAQWLVKQIDFLYYFDEGASSGDEDISCRCGRIGLFDLAVDSCDADNLDL